MKLSAADIKSAQILIAKFENSDLTHYQISVACRTSSDFVRETLKNKNTASTLIFSMFKNRKEGLTIAQIAKAYSMTVHKVYCLFRECQLPIEICKSATLHTFTNDQLKTEIQIDGIPKMAKRLGFSKSYLYTLLDQRGLMVKKVKAFAVLKKHKSELESGAATGAELARRYGISKSALTKAKKKLGVSASVSIHQLPKNTPDATIDKAFDRLQVEVLALRAKKERLKLLHARI